MADDPVIFAYLEAGAKSSAVALDPQLETGRCETVWLFNLARGEFVEYRRDIVETKLRDFHDGEQSLRRELEKAFTKARASFQTRLPRIPDRSPPPRSAPTVAPPSPLADDAGEVELDIDNEPLEMTEDLDEDLT